MSIAETIKNGEHCAFGECSALGISEDELAVKPVWSSNANADYGGSGSSISRFLAILAMAVSMWPLGKVHYPVAVYGIGDNSDTGRREL
jgi:hypothetical protein